MAAEPWVQSSSGLVVRLLLCVVLCVLLITGPKNFPGYIIFRIMRDVPSIVAFCSESIECFPGVASKVLFKYYYYYYYYYYHHHHHYHHQPCYYLYAGYLQLYT
jgi:hypothetical protein